MDLYNIIKEELLLLENYEVATANKKEINRITNKINDLISKFIDNFDNNETISYTENDIEDKLVVNLPEDNLKLIVIYDYTGFPRTEKYKDKPIKRSGGFISSETPNVIMLYTNRAKDIVDDKMPYNKTALYHELQHKIDFDTKYKNYNAMKGYIEPPSLNDPDYDAKYAKYLEQPVEFNAWFTSIVMPFLDDNIGIGFDKTIRKLYVENNYFKIYFNKISKTFQDKFLKRAYKYYMEHNNDNNVKDYVLNNDLDKKSNLELKDDLDNDIGKMSATDFLMYLLRYKKLIPKHINKIKKLKPSIYVSAIITYPQVIDLLVTPLFLELYLEFSSNDVLSILKERPELAEKLLNAKILDNYNIVDIIIKKPDLFDKLKNFPFSRDNIVDILSDLPDLIGKLDLKKLNSRNIKEILEVQPQLKKYFN